MKRKIYVASSWRNEYQPDMVKLLQGLGHEVYDFRHPHEGSRGFHWADIDPNWEHWNTRTYIDALDTDVANEGFKNDFEAMEWADTFVLILPSGRSAHLEMGWACGADKYTAIFIPSPETIEPELMNKMCDLITSDFHELFDWLDQ